MGFPGDASMSLGMNEKMATRFAELPIARATSDAHELMDGVAVASDANIGHEQPIHEHWCKNLTRGIKNGDNINKYITGQLPG